jgi:hypothetical protein
VSSPIFLAVRSRVAIACMCIRVDRSQSSFACSMSSLVNLSPSATPYAYALPSHFEVGPTARAPHRGKMDINQVLVARLPLPLREDFKSGSDAFDGKCFVRFPRRASESPQVRWRLRCQQPAFESMWLPDHCIVDDNMLARVREERRANARKSVGSSASLRGTSARAVNRW